MLLAVGLLALIAVILVTPGLRDVADLLWLKLRLLLGMDAELGTVFDFRYHALSLVAVLVALVVGLLLGVAIGDSGLVSSAERRIRADLRADVRAAEPARDDLQATLAQQDALRARGLPAAR